MGDAWHTVLRYEQSIVVAGLRDGIECGVDLNMPRNPYAGDFVLQATLLTVAYGLVSKGQ